MDAVVLITLFAPLVGFIINGLFGKYIGKKAHIVAVPALGISALGGIYILIFALNNNVVIDRDIFTWLSAGNFRASFGYYLDNLSAIMVFVVTFVSLWIHVYSIGYMKDDESYARYFAYLNFFVFAMLLLVLANNYALMFVGWEGVGLASYLLIGYWFRKQSATDAANKAFIVNRIGDAGFLLGIFTLFALFSSVHFGDIFNEVVGKDRSLLALASLFLFLGAIGKSAQFPLYVWLPDAMEGPTPVSALIHAATMVTAGVYMVARSSPIYVLVPEVGYTIAFVGAFTALLAASMALVNNDIKRIIAYSTISQIGYMFVGVGLGAYWAGIFHLYTHAFFKALLFLGAGAVMHAMKDTLDIWKMGALASKMRYTFLTFLIGALALSGIFPFAGFWSKEAILHASASSGYTLILYMLLLGVFLTAFYVFRLVFVVFLGKPRDKELYEHAHEAPSVMLVPMFVLAIFSIVAGFVHVQFEHFLKAQLPHSEYHGHVSLGIPLWLASSLLAFLGIAVAFFMYVKVVLDPAKLSSIFPFNLLYKLLYNRWYIISDWYEVFILRFLTALSRIVHSFVDRGIVDGLVRASAYTTAVLGNMFRKLQDGRYSTYAVLMVLSFAFILYLFILH